MLTLGQDINKIFSFLPSPFCYWSTSCVGTVEICYDYSSSKPVLRSDDQIEKFILAHKVFMSFCKLTNLHNDNWHRNCWNCQESVICKVHKHEPCLHLEHWVCTIILHHAHAYVHAHAVAAQALYVEIYDTVQYELQRLHKVTPVI